MNLRISIFMFVFSLVMAANAVASGVSIEKSDFASARETKRSGRSVISATLSSVGEAKFKDLNKTHLGKEIKIHISGITQTLKLRAPIENNQLEFGPFTQATAQKIVAEINGK